MAQFCSFLVGGVVALWLKLTTLEPAARFEPWSGTLRCVLGRDTYLSRCLSLPRCINEYRRI